MSETNDASDQMPEAATPEAPANDNSPPRMRSRRGFASMDEETHIRVSRQGGMNAQKTGLAHAFTKAEAKVAGRKGGLRRAELRKARAAAQGAR